MRVKKSKQNWNKIIIQERKFEEIKLNGKKQKKKRNESMEKHKKKQRIRKDNWKV